jgi:hypothetical protein
LFALGRAGIGESVGKCLALDPIHAFASSLERADARALFAYTGRQEATKTVSLPACEVLNLAYCFPFGPAEQGIHLRCFGALAKLRFALLSFRSAFVICLTEDIACYKQELRSTLGLSPDVTQKVKTLFAVS